MMLELPEYAVRDDTIHHLDLMTLCNALPSQSVDLILCDLPYGITACAWDSVIPLVPMWTEFKRVIKPRGAIVLTATQPFTSALVMSNPKWFKYACVWIKSSPTDFIRAKLKPMNRHEDVLIFSPAAVANGASNPMNYYPQGLSILGKRKYRPGGTIHTKIIGSRPSHINDYIQEFAGYPDSILMFANGNHFNVHPTQKPVALFEYLIRTYTQPGELVFDPCVGSGTTAIAARQTGRRFICGDSSREYVEIARKRLAMPYTLPMMEMMS